MLAIFKREFTSLFNNIVGFLFLGINLALFGLYFFIYNIMNGYAYIAYPLSGTTFAFLITVPILTMRIMAEDRKNKADQLILTAPVSVFDIVFGKFLSLAAVFGIEVGVMALSPLFLSLFGTVSFAQAYVAILGYLLFGLTCIAIGVFVSSFTESQMISAVITFVLLFLAYMMNAITSSIGSEDNIICKILNCYDFTTPLDEFLNGNLYVTGIIYFLTVTALCLFLSCQVIQKRRWTISSRSLSGSVFSTSLIVVVIAATVLVNFGATFLPDEVKSIDCTSKKLYTLTDDTIEYLDTLDSDITIYMTQTKSATDDTVRKTLNQYASHSDHITVEYVDTTENPTFTSQYGDSVAAGDIIVVCGDKYTVIASDDMYEYDINYNTYSYEQTGYDGEGQLTSALQYVTSESTDVIWEITGHGETELAGNFESAMTKANFSVESVNLLNVDEIDSSVSAIIVNGPTSDLSDDDTAKIADYIANGGKALLTIDSSSIADMDNYKSILAAYGINIADGIVVDTNTSNYYSSPLYLMPDIESSTVTSSLNSYVFVPYSIGFEYSTDDEATYSVTSLLTTSDESVSKIYDESGKIDMQTSNEGDSEGPFAVGLAIATGGEDNNLYVFGSYLTFEDSADSMVSGTNSQLFGNILGTFKSDTNSSASVIIDSKSFDDETITFTENAIIWYGIAWGILLPLVLIIIGIVVFARRRMKK